MAVFLSEGKPNKVALTLLSLMALLGSGLVHWAGGLVFFFATSLLLCRKEPVKPWQMAGLLYLLLLLCLIYLGFVSYPMMSQAYALYQSTPNLLVWLKAGDVHAPRLLVSYPGVLLSNLCSVPLDTGMSLFTALLFWFTYENMSRAVEELEVAVPLKNWLPALLLFPMTVLSLIMNGRLVFALCGYSLAIATILRLKKRRVLFLTDLLPFILAVLLCVVSTGTLIICIAFCGFLLIFLHGRALVRNPRLTILILLAVLAVLPYVGKMIAKLFAYYGPGLQGIVGILQHGAGRIIARVFSSKLAWVLLIVGFAGILLGMIAVLWYLFSPQSRGHRYYALGVGVLIAFAGFPVGYSTGLMFIVPMMILCCCVAGDLLRPLQYRVVLHEN